MSGKLQQQFQSDFSQKRYLQGFKRQQVILDIMIEDYGVDDEERENKAAEANEK